MVRSSVRVCALLVVLFGALSVPSLFAQTVGDDGGSGSVTPPGEATETGTTGTATVGAEATRSGAGGDRDASDGPRSERVRNVVVPRGPVGDLPEDLPEGGQARYDALRAAAVEARDDGRLEDARLLYREMLRMVPDEARIFYNLGVIAIDMDEYSVAVERFDAAVALGMTDAPVFYNLGNALYRLDRLDEAEGAYRRALESSPEDAQTLNNLALTIADGGRVDEAATLLERAAAADPQWEVPFFHLGNLLYDADEYARAEGAYNEALARNETFHPARRNRGNARYRMEAYRGAFEDFLAVYRVNPGDDDLLYNLGAAAIAAAEAHGADDTTGGDEGDAEAQGE